MYMFKYNYIEVQTLLLPDPTHTQARTQHTLARHMLDTNACNTNKISIHGFTHANKCAEIK